jgi:hypothetical protein
MPDNSLIRYRKIPIEPFPQVFNPHRKVRRIWTFAKRCLGLVLLVLEIVQRVRDLLK